jgi:hypothetical protein
MNILIHDGYIENKKMDTSRSGAVVAVIDVEVTQTFWKQKGGANG